MPPRADKRRTMSLPVDLVERARALRPWIERHYSYRLRGTHSGSALGAVEVLLEVIVEQVEQKEKDRKAGRLR